MEKSGCSTCGRDKELPYPGRRICKECNAAYQRKYRKENREKMAEMERARHAKRRQSPEWVESERARGRAYWQRLRRQALDAYGHVCKCCGETEGAFLTFDHVNNDGAEHRRSLGYEGNGKGASSQTLKWMKDNDYPDSIQVLCMNCNLGKQVNGGICPHMNTA